MTEGSWIYRASRQFIRFSIIIFVICDTFVSDHGHHIWKYRPWSMILVSIYEDPESVELVC